MMDALIVLQLAKAAHIAASYGDRENFYAIEVQHHRKQIEELVFEGNRHRKIAHMMSL
jgi:hypothetical protein